MTKKRSLYIPDVQYREQPSDEVGVECVSLAALFERFSALTFDPCQPHRLKFNNFILITGGSGTHFVDFQPYPVCSGDLIYVSPEQIHAFDSNRRLEGKMLMWRQDFLDDLRTAIRFPVFEPHHVDATSVPLFKASASVARTCDVLMNEIMQATGSGSSVLMIRLLVAALILSAFSARPENPARKPDEHRQNKFRLFLQLVQANFTKTREATRYAELMHVTYKTLNEICKQRCGKTAKQVIDSQIVLEAKRRLVMNQVRIEELADDLGFDEPTNFVKYFKKHTALTPAQFRKQSTLEIYH
jgi:AraC family transcriptional activator of pobA